MKPLNRLKLAVTQPRLWLAIAILLGLLLCILTPLRAIFDPNFVIEHLCCLGVWSIGLFICAYIILTVMGIPGTVLTLAGGAIFGLVWGTLWSVIGATLGAIAAFLLARYLLHDWYCRQFKHSHAFKRFHRAVKRMPFKFVLTIRFAPISPFNVVNFLFGLTPIDLKTYSLGTVVGIIPGTLLYTWLGVTGKEALTGESRLPFLIALTFLALLSLLPFLAKSKST
jgi:uncharacterized membrane protein YdjX (TVP38/TMEM64 family)